MPENDIRIEAFTIFGEKEEEKSHADFAIPEGAGEEVKNEIESKLQEEDDVALVNAIDALSPHISINEGDLKIEDFDLDISCEVEKVLDAAPLEPLILFLKLKDREEPVGVYGFFDPTFKKFITFDSDIIKAKNFDEKFKVFLKEKYNDG